MAEGSPSRKAPRAAARPGFDRAADADDRSRRLEGLGSKATRIVEDAASILEEELANGIDVARNVEQRLFASERHVRDPEAIVPRFRQDAHEIVDLAVDVLSGALASLGDLAKSAVSIRDAGGGEGGSPGGRVPTLTMPATVSPGDKADVAMSVENDSDQPTEPFELNASDLISGDGDRISASQVKFTPRSLRIQPASTAKIVVELAIPKETPPGTYSGLLQATKLEPVRAVLVVTVE